VSGYLQDQVALSYNSLLRRADGGEGLGDLEHGFHTKAVWFDMALSPARMITGSGITSGQAAAAW
jgi:hypothetical protein